MARGWYEIVGPRTTRVSVSHTFDPTSVLNRGKGGSLDWLWRLA
jgi:hypothetical protein